MSRRCDVTGVSRAWRAVLAACLVLIAPSAAAAAAPADWPDGRTTYRVLNGTGNETLAVVCKTSSCQVESFVLSLPARGTPVAVTTPLALDPNGSGSVEVAVDEACGRDTGTLTVTATPTSDLVGTVQYAGVNTPTCITPAGGFGFVAELITAPSGPPAATPPEARSVLSQLRTVGDVSPTEVGLATGGAVVLVALITWPTSLLNSATAAAAARLGRWRSARQSPPADSTMPTTGRESRWWWAAGGVFTAGIISVFVDPAAGFDPWTLRMLASMLAAFAIEVFVGWALALLLVRRLVPGAVPTYTFHPASLLVVAAAVVFSRLTGFQPGVIFGLVAGISFVALQSHRDRATETLVPLGYTFVVAMLAWAGYSLLGEQDAGMGLFASEAMAAAVAAGLAALPLVLLPLRGLPGRTVVQWNRWVWAGSYVMALMGFFVVLMPMPTSWSEVDASLAVWVGGYLAYVVVACVAWFAMREGDDVSTAESPPLA